MKTDPTFWIIARASGLTAYVVMTMSVLLGLTVKSRPLGSRVRSASVTDLHQFVSLLSLGAVAIHGLALVFDTSVPLPLKGLFVPGSSTYRPLAVGIGVVAAELMAVIYLSFSVRKRIGVRNWRRLHYLTFGAFAATTAHGLAAGTDQWAFKLYAGSIAAVAGLTAWRIVTKGGPKRARVQAADRPVAL